MTGTFLGSKGDLYSLQSSTGEAILMIVIFVLIATAIIVNLYISLVALFRKVELPLKNNQFT